jgi:hypothetical protein
MQLNVYINEQLYKSITIDGDTYQPGFIYPQIEADKASGLLNAFDLSKGLSVRYEKVS